MKKISIAVIDEAFQSHSPRTEYRKDDVLDFSSAGEVFPYPHSERWLPAGTPAWGPDDWTREEMPGSFQIQMFVNQLMRFKFRTTHIMIQTTYGELVDVGHRWERSRSPRGIPEHLSVPIINGQEFIGSNEYFDENHWYGKIHELQRHQKGLRPDKPSYAIMANHESIKRRAGYR